MKRSLTLALGALAPILTWASPAPRLDQQGGAVVCANSYHCYDDAPCKTDQTCLGIAEYQPEYIKCGGLDYDWHCIVSPYPVPHPTTSAPTPTPTPTSSVPAPPQPTSLAKRSELGYENVAFCASGVNCFNDETCKLSQQCLALAEYDPTFVKCGGLDYGWQCIVSPYPVPHSTTSAPTLTPAPTPTGSVQKRSELGYDNVAFCASGINCFSDEPCKMDQQCLALAEYDPNFVKCGMLDYGWQCIVSPYPVPHPTTSAPTPAPTSSVPAPPQPTSPTKRSELDHPDGIYYCADGFHCHSDYECSKQKDCREWADYDPTRIFCGIQNEEFRCMVTGEPPVHPTTEARKAPAPTPASPQPTSPAKTSELNHPDVIFCAPGLHCTNDSECANNEDCREWAGYDPTIIRCGGWLEGFRCMVVGDPPVHPTTAAREAPAPPTPALPEPTSAAKKPEIDLQAQSEQFCAPGFHCHSDYECSTKEDCRHAARYDPTRIRCTGWSHGYKCIVTGKPDPHPITRRAVETPPPTPTLPQPTSPAKKPEPNPWIQFCADGLSCHSDYECSIQQDCREKARYDPTIIKCGDWMQDFRCMVVGFPPPHPTTEALAAPAPTPILD
ncbi:hypothetical protein GX51_05019 [Blastomyces parvus]|uniref:Chitin-binding type-2 domain-containing protein n=1 Tax=Blastomyces parvus TaxID=2060905 RepID=A0A2B7WZ02_9EURO|nr:hypothetical protein GX51_05019 [Blastomyces parvus]